MPPQCLSEEDNRDKCRVVADDYLECLHHKKEVGDRGGQAPPGTAAHLRALLAARPGRATPPGCRCDIAQRPLMLAPVYRCACSLQSARALAIRAEARRQEQEAAAKQHGHGHH
jgi:hypothetical protein